ncbi:hypothetical protein Tco_0588896 [Tanacetum coccineum]
MIDYAMWEVLENGATLPKTTTVEGVVTEMPITTAEEKTQRRLEVKARSTLMMGIPNEHHLIFISIKDAKKLLEAVEKRFAEFGYNEQDDLYKQHQGVMNQKLKSSKKSRQQEQGKLKRSVPMKTSTSNSFLSCDGLGGYE